MKVKSAVTKSTQDVTQPEKTETSKTTNEKVESPTNRNPTITWENTKFKLYSNFINWIHFFLFCFVLSNGSTNKGESNPFEEEEWDESDALVDNGEVGVPVKALYDYEGAENDELSFKQGKIFLVFTF